MKPFIAMYFICVLSVSSLFSDVPPPGMDHTVERNVYITNVNRFQEYVLVAYIDALAGSSYPYLIEENIGLTHGYKFNTLYIFPVNRDVFERNGGLSEIDFVQLASENEQSRSPFPSPIAYWVEDNCTAETDSLYYSIQSIEDSNVSFRLDKRVVTYSDKPVQVINY